MQQVLMFTLVLTVAGAPSAPGAADAAASDQRFRQEDKSKKKAADKKAKTDRPKKESGGAAPSSKSDLKAAGTLKELKGTPFYTFDYTANDGKKTAKKSAFVKLGDSVDFYTDKLLRIVDLKQGDAIWVLGFPFESDARGGPNGYTGTDRQMKNVLAVAKGDGLEVNRRYKDSRDPNVRWCEVTVSKAGESIDVQYEGGKYKVVLGKGALVLHRERTGDAKALKSGVQVEVTGDKIEDKPETKNASDAKKESFEAKKVVLLDRRLQTALYPLLNG